VTPLVEAILGLTIWGGVLLVAEWWQHYGRRPNLVDRPEGHQPTLLADEAERWLRER
jgi:hypothetical protein